MGAVYGVKQRHSLIISDFGGASIEELQHSEHSEANRRLLLSPTVISYGY